MALLTAAMIAAGGAVVGGGINAFGAMSASDTQAAAMQQAIAAGQRMSAPFIGLGKGAVGQLESLYGMPMSGGVGQPGGAFGGQPGKLGPGNMPAPGAGLNWQQFVNSPDYQWARDQGTLATQNVLSAQGNLTAGSGLTALTNYGQGLASQQFGNYFQRLLSMAGIGATAAGQSIGPIMGGYSGLGQAQASGAVGTANALSGAASGVGNAANSYATNNMLMSMFQNMRGNSAYPVGAEVATAANMQPMSLGGVQGSLMNSGLGGGGLGYYG